MFKMALSCNLKDLSALRSMSAESRKSAELWSKFQECVSLVDESKFVLKSRVVEFATVIRSVYSDKIITFSGGSRCAFITKEVVPDSLSTFDDVCVSNAYAAYTRALISEDISILMQSDMQSMGIVFYGGRPIVYMNVLVQDEVFDMVLNHTGDVKVAEYCEISDISDFKPIGGSFEEAVADSLVIVGGNNE